MCRIQTITKVVIAAYCTYTILCYSRILYDEIVSYCIKLKGFVHDANLRNLNVVSAGGVGNKPRDT